jgi:hypothetical protein
MTDEEFRAMVLEAFKVQPTGDYHYPFAPNQLRHLVARAVEAEREACAEYAAALAEAGWSAGSIADALRARGSR